MSDGNRKHDNNRNGDRDKKGAQNGAGSSNRKRKKSRKKPRLDPAKYWGDAGALPVRDDYVLEIADPTAVVRSLGKAPIPGKNSAPELYFEVLYTRAAGLAQALAFAGGLNQPTESTPPADGTSVDDRGSAAT